MHPQLSEARFENDLAGVTQELCELRSWTIFEKKSPVFDVGFASPAGSRLRLRLTADSWNDLPPKIALLNWDGSPMSNKPGSNIFHPGPHRDTGQAFICMRGSREYHTHESHVSDHWEPLRNLAEFRLGEIVTQIWNGWRKVTP
jgi:hypothetical protein